MSEVVARRERCLGTPSDHEKLKRFCLSIGILEKFSYLRPDL